MSILRTTGRAMDVETLKGLLERVRAATGPDNRLRCDLLLAIGDPDGTGDWMVRLGTVLTKPGAPTGDVTASLDAALGLVGLALPGWSWKVWRSGFGTPAQAILHDPMKQPAPGYDTRVDHPSGVPALALCAALLTALIAQAEGADHAG